MKSLFIVGQTYTTVTPESAESGDFDDTGWEQEKTSEWRLKDILRALRDQGIENVSGRDRELSIYGWNSIQDYKTMEEKQLCLHIEARSSIIRRLKTIIEGMNK